MAAFIMATQTPASSVLYRRSSWPSSPPRSPGLVNGIGVGVFKVHPLIMTLGLGLVVLGLMNVYQLVVVRPGPTSRRSSIGSARGRRFGFLPNNLLPVRPDRDPDHRRAPLLRVRTTPLRGGRQPDRGATRPASGSGRSWSRLYILSALLAAVAGFLIAGLVKTASLALVESSVLPSVAAAVIGGTSIMGGRGGYAGHDRRARSS